MDRKVFTYKDAEEAKKYIGKRGRFSSALKDIESHDLIRKCCEGILREIVPGSYNFAPDPEGWFQGRVPNFQFFSPDPEPVEKWVPFTADDHADFIGTVVTAVSNKTFRSMIVGCNSEKVFLGGGPDLSYQQLFEGFPKLNGTPCGKRIEP